MEQYTAASLSKSRSGGTSKEPAIALPDDKDSWLKRLNKESFLGCLRSLTSARGLYWLFPALLAVHGVPDYLEDNRGGHGNLVWKKEPSFKWNLTGHGSTTCCPGVNDGASCGFYLWCVDAGTWGGKDHLPLVRYLVRTGLATGTLQKQDVTEEHTRNRHLCVLVSSGFPLVVALLFKKPPELENQKHWEVFLLCFAAGITRETQRQVATADQFLTLMKEKMGREMAEDRDVQRWAKKKGNIPYNLFVRRDTLPEYD